MCFTLDHMETAGPFIIFMGLKHSGKSSIARLTGREFGLQVVDLDDLIAENARSRYPELKPCLENSTCVRTLYKTFGKEVFQAIEAQAAQELVKESFTSLVLALGGGTMENGAAMAALSQAGLIIFLDAASDLLYSRIIRGGLPAFLDPDRPAEHFQEIYERRRAAALAYTPHIITLGSSSLDEVFTMVKSLIKEFQDAR